jgi:hypothetical protein
MYRAIIVGVIGASIFVGQPVTAVQAQLLTAEHVDGLGDIVTILIGSSLMVVIVS